MTKIYITQYDYDRLQDLLGKKRPLDDFDKALLYELGRAEIVTPEVIPDDVITMNSHVQFEDELGLPWDYWLVFPDEIRDFRENKVSILSPVGCALIGCRVGDTVTVHTPQSGRKKLKVQEVIWQPEREGNFVL